MNEIDRDVLRDITRKLGALPKGKRHERTCPVCGKAFMGTARAVYCSQPCQLKAYRRRKKELGGTP